MKPRRISLVALLVLGLSLVPFHNAMAAKGLGLFVTQEELDIWRQRAVSGPYKTTGDVRPNSPGDWDRIVASAAAFKSNPSAERFTPSYSGCLPNDSTAPMPGARQGERLRDAAFYYRVTNDSSYLTPVLNELLAQRAVVGTNFSNTSKFCDTFHSSTTARGWFSWVSRTMVGYSYIRSDISSTNRNSLDQWFLDGADWIDKNVVSFHAKTRFPNRESDDYTVGRWVTDQIQVKYFNGPNKTQKGQGWENNTFSSATAMALIGVLAEGTGLTGVHSGKTPAQLRSLAKRWVREWIVFCTDASQMGKDFDRWKTTHPSLGWGYSGASIGMAVLIADVLARFGDSSLYDFVTADGIVIAGLDTTGGPKSLRSIITMYIDLMAGEVLRYGTDQEANSENPSYLIGSVVSGPGLETWASNRDIHVAVANLYYQDARIKAGYMRTLGNAPGYPPYNVNTATQYSIEYILPGSLFMFGQMEGKVWPYPLKGLDTVPPDRPKNLKLISN